MAVLLTLSLGLIVPIGCSNSPSTRDASSHDASTTGDRPVADTGGPDGPADSGGGDRAPVDGVPLDMTKSSDVPPADVAPADGPPADMTATDGPPGDAGPGGVGAICATQARPGQPGSCQTGLVCCPAAPAVCQAPADCPDGGTAIQCMHGSDCQGGRVCCAVPNATPFCTSNNACANFGGTPVP